ncbi:MAG: ABC transporter permease, partial [Clostridiales bacterium]|nr:ABC transporter permease [Clostridiales bacterium]
MNSIDLIRLTTKNFTRRKARTFLTILGVIIGTAAIVVMLSLGIGMNESFKAQLSQMGSLDVITVTTYYFPNNGASSGAPITTTLDDKAVAKLEKIEGVKAVMPQFQSSMKIGAGKYIMYSGIIGIDSSKMEEFGFKIDKGRLLAAGDTNSILFGCQTPFNFYNPRSRNNQYFFFTGEAGQEPPVDVTTSKLVMTFDSSYGEKKTPTIVPNENPVNAKPLKVYKANCAGVLKQSGDEKDYNVYMDVTYLKKLIKENSKSQNSMVYGTKTDTGYQQALVKVSNIKDIPDIQKQINEMGFGASSLTDILNSMEKTAATMQAVLGGIGAISLLVAALGITNTMIMSIIERTHEIGVMKVLGCLLGDIRRLFLMEAGMIGFSGGIIGILFSYGASWVRS